MNERRVVVFALSSNLKDSLSTRAVLQTLRDLKELNVLVVDAVVDASRVTVEDFNGLLFNKISEIFLVSLESQMEFVCSGSNDFLGF